MCTNAAFGSGGSSRSCAGSGPAPPTAAAFVLLACQTSDPRPPKLDRAARKVGAAHPIIRLGWNIYVTNLGFLYAHGHRGGSGMTKADHAGHLRPLVGQRRHDMTFRHIQPRSRNNRGDYTATLRVSEKTRLRNGANRILPIG